MKVTAYFSTHVLEVAEKLCDNIIMIKKGHDIYQERWMIWLLHIRISHWKIYL